MTVTQTHEITRDAQETFNAVLTFARQMTSRPVRFLPDAESEFGHYRLFDSEGKCIAKCFIGSLIADADYDPEMELRGLKTLRDNPVREWAIREGYDLALLNDLQEIHDRDKMKDWESGFKRVAATYGLHYSPRTRKPIATS